MTRLVLAAAILLAAAPAAWAQRVSRVDGAKLLSICTGHEVVPCDAYISGVADSAATIDTMPELSGRHLGICIPKAVTGAQLRQTVVASLQAHPGDQSHAAVELVLRALKAAYSCDKGV